MITRSMVIWAIKNFPHYAFSFLRNMFFIHVSSQWLIVVLVSNKICRIGNMHRSTVPATLLFPILSYHVYYSIARQSYPIAIQFYKLYRSILTALRWSCRVNPPVPFYNQVNIYQSIIYRIYQSPMYLIRVFIKQVMYNSIQHSIILISQFFRSKLKKIVNVNTIKFKQKSFSLRCLRKLILLLNLILRYNLSENS